MWITSTPSTPPPLPDWCPFDVIMSLVFGRLRCQMALQWGCCPSAPLAPKPPTGAAARPGDRQPDRDRRCNERDGRRGQRGVSAQDDPPIDAR